MKYTFLTRFVNIAVVSLLSACGSELSTQPPLVQVVPTTLGEIEAHFDNYPCGVDFDASFGMGDLSLGCYRTPGGGAECISRTASNDYSAVPVVWLDSQAPVTGVLHVSAGGTRGTGVTVVTTDGKIFHGGFQGLLAKPLVDSGAISVSGGFFEFCAIVNSNNKKDVLCSDGNHDDYALERPKGLPKDFDAMQIDVGWGEVCALNSKGEQWCWAIQAGNPVPIQYGSPVKFISMVESYSGGSCAIKFDGYVECTDLDILQDRGLDTQSISLSREYVVSVSSNGDAVVHHSDGRSNSLHIQGASVVGGGFIGGSAGAMLIDSEGEVYRVDYEGAAHKIEGAKAQVATCPFE